MAYKYLFFRLYKLAASLDYDKTPEFTAIFSISGLFLLNFGFIANLAEHFNIPLPIYKSRINAIVFSLIILSINLILIYKIFGVDKIKEQFSKINKPKEKIFNVMIIIYIITTFILYFYSNSLIKPNL